MHPTKTTFTEVDHLQAGWDSDMNSSSGHRAYLEVECVIYEGTFSWLVRGIPKGLPDSGNCSYKLFTDFCQCDMGQPYLSQSPFI